MTIDSGEAIRLIDRAQELYIDEDGEVDTRIIQIFGRLLEELSTESDIESLQKMVRFLYLDQLALQQDDGSGRFYDDTYAARAEEAAEDVSTDVLKGMRFQLKTIIEHREDNE